MEALGNSYTEELKVLVVDDELASLQKLRRTLVDRYPVLSASNGIQALDLVEKDPAIAVIITDQRMPDMTGVEFLRLTMDRLPHAIRIILTGFTDVDVLMEAINTCKVFRYLVKPWDPPDLLITVERGLEAYRLAIENERFRKELVRRERLARELEIARQIQRYILPPRCPALEGYRLAVAYCPAREVGGDLYDFHWNPVSDSLEIVVGDVSGKSIPAALYGAVFSGHLRTLFARQESPSEKLAFLNSSLMSRYEVANFIAAAYVHLNLSTGAGLVANGGMPYPYLVHNGEVTELQVSGIPLGFFRDTRYEEAPFRMEEGDLLLLASDGATDAASPAGELYDSPRLADSIRRYARDRASDCVQNVYHAISEFTSGAEVNDDITILALQRDPSSGVS